MGFSSMWRRGVAVLTGVLLAVVALPAVATASPGATASDRSTHSGSAPERAGFPEGHFLIRNADSGLVLDARPGGTGEGTPVVLWYRNGDEGQLWEYDDGALVNKASGLCLEVEGASGGGDITPGTLLVQSARREPPNNLNQLWAYNYRYLMPYDPKVAIAAEGDDHTPGARAVVDRVDFPDNVRQQWDLVGSG